jgi:hypothetical protein
MREVDGQAAHSQQDQNQIGDGDAPAETVEHL